MSGQSLLTVWSSSAVLSGLIWLVIIVVLLYLARRPAHEVIRNVARMLYRAFRLSAASVMRLESRLARRNREVLMAIGEANRERVIEREFQRVSTTVARDLGDYPALHRSLSEQITQIDEDYRQSTEVPPAPPAWLDAVDAVANIPSKDDPAVNKILEDIHATLERSCHNTVMEYRAASHRRHKLLRRMLPYWRGLRDKLQEVNKTVTGLEERSHQIDKHMARYEEIRGNTDPMARTLASSSITQFFIAGLVLVIAAVGVFINFNLVARPMAEMVGGLGGTGAGTLGGFPVADVAAMFIVLVAVFLGVFLMELLNVTRLFPVVGSWDNKNRQILAWIILGMLLIIAAAQASLAFLRDDLLAQEEALRQYLMGGDPQALQVQFGWIPAVTQMVMAFLLPFALALVAIPLEYFIHSGRTVVGTLAVGFLRVFAYLLRLIGNLLANLGEVLVRVYDLLVFLPLAIEGWIRQARGTQTVEPATTVAGAGGSATQSAPEKTQRRRRSQSRQSNSEAADEAGSQDNGNAAPESGGSTS